MAIVPDTKNWTWVLERECPECGLDVRTVEPDEVPGLLRENATMWLGILSERDEADLRRRPADDRWSVLEYACHIRDVFALFDRRLELMLEEDGPRFENWDQDATAVADRYGEQDPAEVARRLETAAGSLSDRLAGVQGDAWGRTGTRSDGAEFTVASFSRYLLHDPVHHLYDVATGTAEGE
jgi:hypothetical protein